MHLPEVKVVKHVVTYHRAISIRCAATAAAAAAADSDVNSAIVLRQAPAATLARFAAGIT